MSNDPIESDDAVYNAGSVDTLLLDSTSAVPSTTALLSMTEGVTVSHPPPPSSLHGEADEDDQPLPVDDSFHNRDGLNDNMDDYFINPDVIEHRSSMSNPTNNAIGVRDMTFEDAGMTSMQHDDQQHPISVPTPQLPELTLKEKLVLRERQQRIETERARLKRQFALSATNEEIDNGDATDGTMNHNHNGINHSVEDVIQDDVEEVNNEEFEEESTRAHPDEEDAAADEANRRLGFNMERFLRNSDSFHPELDAALEVNAMPLDKVDGTTDATKGVVMERFLNEMVENAHRTAGTFIENAKRVLPMEAQSEPPRGVSFDVDNTNVAPPDGQDAVLLQPLDYHQDALLTSLHPSFGGESAAGISLASNASLRTEANTVHDEFFSVDPPLYSTSSIENLNETDHASHGDVSSRVSDDEPRVLRLTEADMLEMAAIEEASIGNAPPSDRDDVESYSELGELTDFGGTGGSMHRFLGDPNFVGPDTPTTALESASQISQRSVQRGGVSAVSSSTATIEHTDVDIVTGRIVDMIDGIPLEATDAEHYYVASASASIAANPPSEGGRDVDYDETLEIESQLNDIDTLNQVEREVDTNIPFTFNEVDNLIVTQSNNFGVTHNDNEVDSHPVEIATTTNRQRRFNPNDGSIDGTHIESTEEGNIVDDFDYDKDNLQSPFVDHAVRSVMSNDDSFRNLPNDPWSPSSQMQVSPLQVGSTQRRQMLVIDENNGRFDHSIPLPIHQTENPSLIDLDKQGYKSETTPLLPRRTTSPVNSTEIDSSHIPSTDASTRISSSTNRVVGRSYQPSSDTLQTNFASMICDVRSKSESDNESMLRESEVYRAMNVFSRAIPDRQLALILTMVLQIPVLIMITGGSDFLCAKFGRRRYQLLIGFLPLTCALSGNLGLQASAVTTRAILCNHVTSESYGSWIVKEVTVAACLGLGIGTVLGIIAYFASLQDFAFGITILFAQCFCSSIAGITGTLGPILFNAIFKHNTNLWCTMMLTTIQDIFGCFVVVFVSHHIFAIFTDGDVELNDRCIVIDIKT